MKWFKDFLSRISSRKFIFWVTSTVFFVMRRMTAKEWIVCSVIFIGGKVLEMLFEIIKGRKSE